MSWSGVQLLSLLVLALVAFGFALAWWWERGRASRASRARLRVAHRGEEAAISLLAAHGFEVEQAQVTGRWTLWVDDEPVEVTNRIDFLVRGTDGVRVAEVKTGGRAPDPRHPATRRQLLEYCLAYQVDGVLLVDMVEGRIHEVRFDLPSG
jgi:hypothetical protein